MSKKHSGGVFILFGASGDLGKRFIFPALHQLYQRGKLSDKFAIIGTARTGFSEGEFKEYVEEAVKGGPNFEEFSEDFLELCYYHAMDNTKAQDYGTLHNKIDEIIDEHGIERNFLYYYSLSPSLFEATTENLKKSGIVDDADKHRVIVEKPFGNDLESAEKYYEILLNTFKEDEIYLNDHFPAMDMAQNILATRYYNPMIDGILNAEFIDNVQISLPEKLSIGSRGGFYDDYGASLDMFQNHILQLLTLVAMDLPEEIKTDLVHEKKLEVLESIPSFSKEEVEEKVVRGQYKADHKGKFNNYRDEEDVPDDSITDTYFAAELEVNTKRWEGVPFYVRTGKSLAEDFFVVDYIVKTANESEEPRPNRITFHVKPKNGLSIVLAQKEMSNTFEPMATELETKEIVADEYIPDPFENIIHDAIEGEKLLFTTFKEVKEQWRIADSILEAWADMPEPDFPNYRAATFGPEAADALPKKNGDEWIYRLPDE